MNILNNSYFSGDQFQKILRNFHSCLDDDGLLIVGSNLDPDTPIAGAIYRKTMSTFTPLWIAEEQPNIHQYVSAFDKHGA
jgi:hypothetical protein